MTPTISLTDLAKQKLNEYLSEEPDDTHVRLLVEESGKYGLSLDQKADGDIDVEGAEGIKTVVEEAFASVIDGLKVDYLDQGASSGFSLTGGAAGKGLPVVIRVEETPNPDARKFVLSIEVTPGKSETWTDAEQEGIQPAVKACLEMADVEQVFLLGKFATVNRVPDADWEPLLPKLQAALMELKPAEKALTGYAGDPNDLTAKITHFIETDVAPFLQRDGGDIELVGIDEGVVKVRLHGACGSCPSSTATLHMGVERRLKEQFAEVQSLERV